MSIIATGLLFSWILFLWTAYRGVKHLPVITALAARVPTQATTRTATLSVVIAVKDEAMHLATTLAHLSEVGIADLEVIVVDDRSSDGTAEVVRGLAKTWPLLRLVRITTLPDGWLGKVHALHQGVTHAHGDFVLFMDADVTVSRRLLQDALSVAQHLCLDHLAVLPRVQCASYSLAVMITAAEVLFTMSARPWLGIAERPLQAVKGVGPFNLVRKAAFDRREGFAWLKMEVADDIALAQLMAKDGGRSLFAKVSAAAPVAAWTWYGSVGAMVRGLEKNAVGGFTNYQWPWMIALPLGAVTGMLWPFAALWWPVLSWPWATGMAAICLLLVFTLAAHRYLGRSVAVIAALPIGIAGLGFVLARSSYLCVRRGGISWSGTFYSLSALKKGLRVKLRF